MRLFFLFLALVFVASPLCAQVGFGNFETRPQTFNPASNQTITGDWDFVGDLLSGGETVLTSVSAALEFVTTATAQDVPGLKDFTNGLKSAGETVITSLHSNDATIHFIEGDIDHTAIQNIGTNTHAQIDTHIADVANPHDVSASQVDAVTTTGTQSASGAKTWTTTQTFEGIALIDPAPQSLTYYVATTGSAANDGLTNGTALDTIENALDEIPFSHQGGVTIKLLDGTGYTGAIVSNWSKGSRETNSTAHEIVIESEDGVAADVTITVAPTLANAVICVNPGGRVQLSNITIGSTTTNDTALEVDASLVVAAGCNFLAQDIRVIDVANGGHLELSGTTNVTGNALGTAIGIRLQEGSYAKTGTLNVIDCQTGVEVGRFCKFNFDNGFTMTSPGGNQSGTGLYLLPMARAYIDSNASIAANLNGVEMEEGSRLGMHRARSLTLTGTGIGNGNGIVLGAGAWISWGRTDSSNTGTLSVDGFDNGIWLDGYSILARTENGALTLNVDNCTTGITVNWASTLLADTVNFSGNTQDTDLGDSNYRFERRFEGGLTVTDTIHSETAMALTTLAAEPTVLSTRPTFWSTDGRIFVSYDGLIEDLSSWDPQFVEGLRIANTITAPLSQIDLRHGHCMDSTDSVKMTLETTVTVDLEASGAGGLDTGSEAADTWYFTFLISVKSTGVTTGLLSTSTSPLLPGVYTHFRRIGCIRNDAGSDIQTFVQRGTMTSRSYSYTTTFADRLVISAGAATTPTLVDLSSLMPPLARNVAILVHQGSGVRIARMYQSITGAILDEVPSNAAISLSNFPTAADQSIGYDNDGIAGNVDITVRGFSEDL